MQVASSSITTRYLLTEDSVVLITGGGSFIGTQLALGLFHTYNISQVIIFDTLGAESLILPNAKGKYSMKDTETNKVKEAEKSLSLFEFRRKRLFHVLRTLPRAKFIRADFRSPIPEFKNNYQFPLLNKVFQQNPGISHIVHLAGSDSDFPSHSMNYRSNLHMKPQEGKTVMGMIDSLFEQMVKIKEEKGQDFVPHFIYISSGEAYSSSSKPVQDEIIASTYNKVHNLFSVGLRFSHVYGPWHSPGTSIYEMCEYATSNHNTILEFDEFMSQNDEWLQDRTTSIARDFIFIDDAVDAIMAAMQFRPPMVKKPAGSKGDTIMKTPSFVFNIESGLRSTYFNVTQMIKKRRLNPRNHDDNDSTMAEGNDHYGSNGDDIWSTASNATSTKKTEILLGFQPQVSMQEGISLTLSWHYDQNFPYRSTGRYKNNDTPMNFSADRENMPDISDKSMNCLPFDGECLLGAKPSYCASECTISDFNCMPSMYDNVIQISKAITNSCPYVIYTIDLKKKVGKSISLANTTGTELGPNDHRSLPSQPGKHCHLAFVSKESDLVQSILSATQSDLRLLSHGFWTLIPIHGIPSGINSSTRHPHLLRFLPKYSPGSFFSSNTKYAIYHDSDVSLLTSPSLPVLDIMQHHPFNEKPNIVMAIADGLSSPRRQKDKRQQQRREAWEEDLSPYIEMMQNSIRTALQGLLIGGGTYPITDSSWIVHSLQSNDAHLLRCDIYEDISSWNLVENDQRSIEFVIGFHNFWTETLAQWNNEDLWWSLPPNANINNDSTPKALKKITSRNDTVISNDDPSFDAEYIKQAGYWLGVLSSTKNRALVRIVPSESVGTSYYDEN